MNKACAVTYISFRKVLQQRNLLGLLNRALLVCLEILSSEFIHIDLHTLGVLEWPRMFFGNLSV